MGDINVVPYIDVMLVLLVIFMVTAPMLTQGVKVNLPRADANPVAQSDKEPLVVSVDREGRYFLASDRDNALDKSQLMIRLSAKMRLNPGQPVYVRGDREVPYGKVVEVMVVIQRAGAPSVGLLTDPVDEVESGT